MPMPDRKAEFLSTGALRRILPPKERVPGQPTDEHDAVAEEVNARLPLFASRRSW